MSPAPLPSYLPIPRSPRHVAARIRPPSSLPVMTSISQSRQHALFPPPPLPPRPCLPRFLPLIVLPTPPDSLCSPDTPLPHGPCPKNRRIFSGVACQMGEVPGSTGPSPAPPPPGLAPSLVASYPGYPARRSSLFPSPNHDPRPIPAPRAARRRRRCRLTPTGANDLRQPWAALRYPMRGYRIESDATFAESEGAILLSHAVPISSLPFKFPPHSKSIRPLAARTCRQC